MIPAFRPDGFLPEGLHPATEAEVVARFGTATRRRQLLMLRLSHWLELARQVGATRLLVGGSFVTAKQSPKDVDAAIWLPDDFDGRVEAEDAAAVELSQVLIHRQPEEMFPVRDEIDWEIWCEFFARARLPKLGRKGSVEVTP